MAMMYKKNWKQESVFICILTFNSIKLRNKKQVTQLNEHGTQKVYKRTRPKYIKHWMALNMSKPTVNTCYDMW